MANLDKKHQSYIIEMSDAVSLREQLAVDEPGEVVLLNIFRFPAECRAEVIAAWERDAEFMQRQPGFISAQLHNGHGGSNTLFNYAVWASVADLRNVLQSPGFAELARVFPAEARISPHVFRTLAIEGVCEGQVAAKGLR